MAINLDANFLARIADLQAAAQVIAQAMLTDSQRVWVLPSGYTGNPLDPSTLGSSYSREELSALYQLIMTGQNTGNSDSTEPSVGSTGDEMACRVQADYLSAQERALRLRHSTAVRCQAHAAARRTGHSASMGSFGRVVSYAQDLVAAGASA